MSFLKSITFWSQQWKFLGTYSVILAAVLATSNSLPIIATLSMAFTGLFLADFLVKTHQEFFADRSFIGGIENYAVVVTGCDTGFGLHFAQRFADLGFLVYATVLFPEGMGAQMLKKYDNIVVVKLDVTRQEEVDNLAAFVAADLDVRKKTFWSLVNNAGIAFYVDVEVASMDHFEQIMRVNAFGPLRMCKALLPLMRANKRGRIVNITSLAGRHTIPFTTGYSMSKHALNAFSDGLRCELKPWNISVHTVQPSFYQTSEIFADTLNGIVDYYVLQWEKAPENVKKSFGLQFRDARVNAMKSLCCNYLKPITKMDEVAYEVIDAVAGVAPQICYTPNTLVKVLGRIAKILPFELLDFFISPSVEEPPAELVQEMEMESSLKDSSSSRCAAILSSAWRYANLTFKMLKPSATKLDKRNG